MPGTRSTASTPFREFRVVLDDPAPQPGGGFGTYAQALADVILRSPPRFAIGVFGSWGSGKTTLMNAIAGALKSSPRASEVVQVEFNAWLEVRASLEDKTATERFPNVHAHRRQELVENVNHANARDTHARSR